MIRFLFVLEWLMRFFHLGAALRLQQLNRRRLICVSRDDNDSVSVFIHMCAFNGSRTIEQAVESVKGQTHQNWTLFISDDASTDETWGLIEKLASSDDRIETFRLSENLYSRGLSHRNVGLDRFKKGSWNMYTVLDQDDVAEFDWLQNCLGLDWRHISVLRMWNARYDADLLKKKFEYPAAAQIMVPRREVDGINYRRGLGLPADTGFLYRMEFRALKRFKAVVVAPFLCHRMRFSETNQSANNETVTVGKWAFFWKYFWSA